MIFFINHIFHRFHRLRMFFDIFPFLSFLEVFDKWAQHLTEAWKTISWHLFRLCLIHWVIFVPKWVCYLNLELALYAIHQILTVKLRNFYGDIEDKGIFILDFLIRFLNFDRPKLRLNDFDKFGWIFLHWRMIRTMKLMRLIQVSWLFFWKMVYFLII